MVTQEKSDLGNLSEPERRAVEDFLARVHETYGKQIREAVLFGSKARGEATPDSDVDVLLIVADESWQLRDEICGISADVSLQHDLLLDARVIGEDRWGYLSEIGAGLYRNVSREGIPLAI